MFLIVDALPPVTRDIDGPCRLAVTDVIKVFLSVADILDYYVVCKLAYLRKMIIMF